MDRETETIAKKHADALRESQINYKTTVVRLEFVVLADRAEELRQALLEVAGEYGAARGSSSCGGGKR